MNIISIKLQNDTNGNKPANKRTNQSIPSVRYRRYGNHRHIKPSYRTADSEEGRSLDQTPNREGGFRHQRDNSHSCHNRAGEGDTTDERGKYQSERELGSSGESHPSVPRSIGATPDTH